MLDLDICSSFARNLRRKHQPKPSDCPDLLTADALPARRIHAQVGTIVRSEQSALFRHRNNADSALVEPSPTSFGSAIRTTSSARRLQGPKPRVAFRAEGRDLHTGVLCVPGVSWGFGR